MTIASHLNRREGFALLGIVVAIVVWLLLPEIAQPQEYHQFADRRTFLGVPNAADVLSNAAFIVVAVFGLWRLGQSRLLLASVVRASMLFFFIGLLLTGFGSGYYHWNPNDQTLVWDRLPMTIAFAGMLGALFAERISRRAGAAILVLMLILGPASVFYWKASDDLAPYGLVQFGAIAAVLAILLLTEKGRDPFPWWALVLWYLIAKVAETADVAIWIATGQTIAGHALKHIAAAIGGWYIAKAIGPAPSLQ